MTSQEVRALIDAKIKGQGTNVDAGSVLPAILNGILDLIDSGGGGGTSDAVQYIPQELTAPQQMQARKNQGLYYEAVEDVEIACSYTQNNRVDVDNSGGVPGVYYYLYKLSSLNVNGSDVKSIYVPDYDYEHDGVFSPENGNLSVTSYTDYDAITCSTQTNPNAVNVYVVKADGTTVTTPGGTATVDTGIWALTTYIEDAGEGVFIDTITINTAVTHKVEDKYLPAIGPAVKIKVPSQSSEYYNIGHTVLNNFIRSRDVKFSVDIEGFRLSWLSIVDMSDPTTTIEGDLDSDTYTFTSAGSYLVTLNLVDSEENSRNISAILVVIDISS